MYLLPLGNPFFFMEHHREFVAPGYEGILYCFEASLIQVHVTYTEQFYRSL